MNNNIILIQLLFIILVFMISFYLFLIALQNRIGCNNRYSNRSKFYNNVTDFNEIIPNLYIGNIDGAQNKDFLINKKIKVIINCTKDLPNYFQSDKKLQIEYYRLAVNDSLLDEDIELMTEYLPKYVNIINESLKNNKPVFVHCYAGRQRSACLIAAYLMYKYNYTLEQTYKYIIDKRNEAFHYGKSFNFHKSLLKYNDLIE